MDIDEVDRIFKFMCKRMMHTVPEIFKVPTIMKSADSSNKVSQYAKEYFIKKDYFNALWLYDRAIACADSKELLAKGYAKRSKIYFELGRYEDCLNSIQLALENEYPADKLPKLKEREEKCKEMMSQAMDVEDKEDLWDFFKLSYPANEKIPWLVDRVEMRWTEKYGRGIYAKEDLKAGDIICIEEPAINYAHEDNTYMRCFNCFKTNALNLIPCDVTGSLMFCSATCKDNFNEKASDITEMRCADLKMLSEIFEAFGSVNRFDDFMERIDPKKDLNKTIFDYDWTNPEDPQYKRNKILCLLSLTTNERPILRNYIVGKHVSEKTARHLMSIFMLNFQEVYYNNGDSKSSNVGWCIPLFSSLINHSCVRNAVPILVDNKIVTIMQKPVKAGEQIFFCYPPNSIMFNSVLLKTVQINHEFHCECEICANDLELDLADQNALLEPFKNEPNPAYDRDYDKTREYLKEAWNILNNDPPTVKGYSPHMLRTVEVLETIAFQIAYPFNPPEPELF